MYPDFESARWRVAMALFAKYQDDAAAAMMRHKDIAEPLLQSYGPAAASALRGISPQNGRRMAMMNDAGDWSKIGAKAQLLDLVARYGDWAMDYLWRNRATLVREIARQAFLANPEPFLDGSDDLQKYADPPVTKNADSP